MPKSKHSEASIMAAVQQLDRPQGSGCGAPRGRQHYTIYAWKAKYGGVEVSEAQEVKQLRDENARLKRLVRI